MTSDAEQFASTDRTRLRRIPEQGTRNWGTLEAILDASFVCHLGVIVNGRPVVVPTSYGRRGRTLYLHGSVASQSLRDAQRDPEVCVTITHVDGIVLARSVFNHAVNYRSVMIFGVPEILTESKDKVAGLKALTDHVAPGQWDYARSPTPKELSLTTVLRLELSEVSVKVREGPPDDADGPDGALDIWAGEVPLELVARAPVSDPTLGSKIQIPAHLKKLPSKWGFVA